MESNVDTNKTVEIKLDQIILEILFKILYKDDKITKKEYKKIIEEIQCTVNS